MTTIQIGLSDILLISPLIALFLFSLVPLSIKVLRGNKEQNPLATLLQAMIGLIVTAGLIILFGGEPSAAGFPSAFVGQLYFDGLTKWIGLLLVLVTAGALVLMYENPSTKGNQFSEIVFLAMNSLLGALVLIAAVHLITLFIGLELMSLALYLMIAMSHEQKLSKEAAVKYFVLGSLSSAIFLYGISFVYGSTGTANIIDLVQKTDVLLKTGDKLFTFGFIFLLIGFCFKVSIAPFHAWTPDVYQGAPTPVTVYMATMVKAASFAAFLRLLTAKGLIGSENLFVLLQWFAVITMTLGNVAAIMQNNFKRILAYSSIAHSGYILVGLIATGVSGNSVFAASSVVFYLLAYSLMTLGAFAVLSLVEKDENSSVLVEDFAGFAKTSPFLAFCLTLFLLSMAGIPPVMGFFGKFYMFSAAIGEGLTWLVLWGVINSVISVYFYLRPIVMMYMKEGGTLNTSGQDHAGVVVVAVSALLVVVLGVFSGPILKIIEMGLG